METEQLRWKAIAATPGESQSDRSTGKQQAERQLELARQIDKLQADMEEFQQRTASDDPTVATVKGGADAARQLALGSRMREAASRLGQNQLGEALRSQQDIVDGLRSLVRGLSAAEGTEGQVVVAGESGQGGSKTERPGRGTGKTGGGTGEPMAEPSRSGASGVERGLSMEPKDIAGRLWGHLPERLQQEMQSSFSEQFLPQYERLIEEYYKRLAEERPRVP